MSGIPKLHQSYTFLKALDTEASSKGNKLTKEQYETFARKYVADHKKEVKYSDFSFAKINRDENTKELSLDEIKSQEFIAQQGATFWKKMNESAYNFGVKGSHIPNNSTCVIRTCGNSQIWDKNTNDSPVNVKKAKNSTISPNPVDLSNVYKDAGVKIKGFYTICDVASFMDDFVDHDGVITGEELRFATDRLTDQ